MRVLVTEAIWPEGIDELESFATVEHDHTLETDRASLLEKVRSADALIVRNQTRVDAELLEAGTSLKVVGRPGVGLDNVDLGAAREHNVSACRWGRWTGSTLRSPSFSRGSKR